MDFPHYDFATLNETDIREEIIAPLLRELGYRSGTPNNVIREQPLSYPLISLGRKKKTDPILRGKADYICDIQDQVRWVIEAKSPTATLDREVEEQAWTYANHPEIRAVYFCLSNGKETRIYQTNRGPDAGPIFLCSYEEMAASLETIHNILSPESIIRDHPEYKVDYGNPIGPGLRSLARIVGGSITYTHNNIDFIPLNGMTTTITEGSIERNINGQLEAYIKTQVPYQSLHELNEKLGLNAVLLSTEHSTLSTNPNDPTVFSANTEHVLPKGESILNLMNWKEEILPTNITVQVHTQGIGHLQDNVFLGEFHAQLIYMEVNIKVELNGIFNVHIA